MAGLRITVDGAQVIAEPGATVLDVAQAAGIYVPYLCSHPDLPDLEPGTQMERVLRAPDGAGPEATHEGCWLCAVEVDGDLVRACSTAVAAGMRIETLSETVVRCRRRRLGQLLAGHPHLCPSCARDEGLAEVVPPAPPSSEGIGAAALFSLIEEAFAPAPLRRPPRRCPGCELRLAIEPAAVVAPGDLRPASGLDDLDGGR